MNKAFVPARLWLKVKGDVVINYTSNEFGSFMIKCNDYFDDVFDLLKDFLAELNSGLEIDEFRKEMLKELLRTVFVVGDYVLQHLLIHSHSIDARTKEYKNINDLSNFFHYFSFTTWEYVKSVDLRTVNASKRDAFVAFTKKTISTLKGLMKEFEQTIESLKIENKEILTLLTRAKKEFLKWNDRGVLGVYIKEFLDVKRLDRTNEIKNLIEQLKDENENVKIQARQALINIGKPSVPALIQALKNEDRRVRTQTVWMIGKIKDSRAIPALIQTLKDENENVRYGAITALGMIGNSKAAPALTTTLKYENENARYNTTWALERIISCVENEEMSPIIKQFNEQLGLDLKKKNDLLAVLELFKQQLTLEQIKQKIKQFGIQNLYHTIGIIQYAFKHKNDQAFQWLYKLLEQQTNPELFKNFFENSIPSVGLIKEELAHKGVQTRHLENYTTTYNPKNQKLERTTGKTITDTEIRETIYDTLIINFYGSRKKGIKPLLNTICEEDKKIMLKKVIGIKKELTTIREIEEILIYLKEHVQNTQKKEDVKKSHEILNKLIQFTTKSNNIIIGSGNFFIKTWNRNPYHDLARSDEFMCCAFLGGVDEEAAMHYFFDPRIVMLDFGYGDTRNWRAICMIYYNQLGQPTLVIDSIEGTSKNFDENTKNLITQAIKNYVKKANLAGGAIAYAQPGNNTPKEYVKYLKQKRNEKTMLITPVQEGYEIPIVGSTETYLELLIGNWNTPQKQKINAYTI